MYYYLIRRSSSDTRDVPNKDVEKMQDIDEKRRKCKIYLNLIMTARLARRLAGFAAEKWTFRLIVSNQTYSCTCISSAVRNTIVNP